MRSFAAFLAMCHALAVCTAVAQCPKPSGRLVTVAPGVRIHVIDWGGAGPPLVFLSGLLGSAYTFDDFAPLFTDRYRVIGITRRGIAPSDQSASGYGWSVLTKDILATLDSLEIPAAHIVGWSFGGNEAVMLAVSSPRRVSSLVLLDSYETSPEARRLRTADSLKSPSSAPFVSFDSLSPLSLQWRYQRLGERPLPLSALCAYGKFAKDGRYLGPVLAPPRLDSVTNAMRGGMPRLPYSAVRQPVLALFRRPRGVGDGFPTYATMSPTDRLLADAKIEATTRDLSNARAWLRSQIPHAKVIEIPGAAHAIFRSHPEAVFRDMRSFLEQIPTKPQ
jgi:non-heme chloroperoxidase